MLYKQEMGVYVSSRQAVTAHRYMSFITIVRDNDTGEGREEAEERALGNASPQVLEQGKQRGGGTKKCSLTGQRKECFVGKRRAAKQQQTQGLWGRFWGQLGVSGFTSSISSSVKWRY